MSTLPMPAIWRRRAAILTFTILIATSSAGPVLAGAKAKTFKTPEAAVDALIDAMRQNELAAMVAIFGEGSDQLLETGDAVQDANRREEFLALYDEKHELQPVAGDRVELVIGEGAWPYPIPLVKVGKKWSFDTASGIEEIINRRVGENELKAIQSCLTAVDAQREYASRDHDGDGILEYAQKFRSTIGRRDGLFWPTREGEPDSPLGEMEAAAAAEGYLGVTGDAFHGYHYRLLTSQGPNAPGGAYDYLVRDNLIGGFAVLAFPAEYDESGVMTFLVSHHGVVYQRDLGPETAVEAEKITTFDPSEAWEVVPETDLVAIPWD